ncbi:MAG: hypothetical protein Q9209_002975 [Squamulea sp. 1 TL-2023]
MVQTRLTSSEGEKSPKGNEFRASSSSVPGSPASVPRDMQASVNSGNMSPSHYPSAAGDNNMHSLQDSIVEGNSSQPSQRLRLRSPSESGLSSDNEYEDDEEDEYEEDNNYDEDDRDDEESGLGSVDGDYAEEDSDNSQPEAHPKATPKEPAKRHPDAPAKRHPDAPAVSKLRQKIQDSKQKGVELDENGVKKGKARHTSLGLEYFHLGEWQPACYHSDIRHKIFKHTEAMGSYVEEPTSGADEFDRTAYKPEQRDWVFSDRNKRPDVLFLWENPGDAPNYSPLVWFDGQRIVLDRNNRPVKLWDELPLAISGQCEGARAEAWRRLNPRITMNDLIARMPFLTSKGKDLAQKAPKTPMLANRMSRDRIRFGLKAWIEKDGSAVKEHRMLQTMPEVIQKLLIRTNSTRGYRDLTDAEMLYVDEANKGTATSRAKAGPRVLDDAARQENEKKQQRRRSKKPRIDLNSVTIYEVIPEALRKPEKKQRRRKQSSASPVASSSKNPPRKRERDETQEDHGMNDMLATEYGQGSQEQPYVLAGEDAPPSLQKKPRRSQAATSSTNVQKNHNNGNSASGVGYRRSSNNHPAQTSRSRYSNIETPAPAQLNPPRPTTGQHTPLPNNPHPDFRLIPPRIPSEIALVQEALIITRNHYQHLLGFPPTITTSQLEPYVYQLNELQDAFNRTYPGEDPPRLLSWGQMSSFDSFKTPRGLEGGN